MRVLLVEDIDDKANDILAFMEQEFPSFDVKRCKAYNSAQETIFESEDEFDLILLDMSMSTYDLETDASGGLPEPQAGRDLLEGMFLREITTPVIVVTMYNVFGRKELSAFHKELLADFPQNYKDYVYYSAQRNDWKKELKNKINKVLK